jgi:predicted amidophosphoribosyltransferase
VEGIYDYFLRCLERVPTGPNTCSTCHRDIPPRYSHCHTCLDTIGQVSRPANLVIPISMYRLGTPAHAVFRGYKDHEEHRVRAQLAGHLAQLITDFLRLHRPCITAAAHADWDAIVVVPSTSRHSEFHPLHLALSNTCVAAELELGLRHTTTHLDHHVASDTGYITLPGIERRNILLLDDTYTTGARLHSAASALQLAGIRLIAAVVTGRVLDPLDLGNGHHPEDGFSPSTCCLASCVYVKEPASVP